MVQMNRFRHYFLYAKNHYKRTDVFEDLKRIQCNYVGCSLSANITRVDIIRVTTRAIQPILVNRKYPDIIEKYQDYLFQYGNQYMGGFEWKTLSMVDSMILANLGIMMSSTNDEIEGSLGEPDASILELGY